MSEVMHLMTIELGAWCGASGPGNGRASSQWREVTCPQCTAKGMTQLRALVRDMLDTMPASREALSFAVRAGRLGVTGPDGRPLVPACASDGEAVQRDQAAPAVAAHVHDYDEDGDCVRCGRDLFAGGEDGATPEAAATAVTPGQSAYKAWQARRTGIPDGDWHWDLLVANENAREAWEDAGRAAIEAARLRQPEELRAALAETRKLREVLGEIRAMLLKGGRGVVTRVITSIERAGITGRPVTVPGVTANHGDVPAEPDVARALDLARDELTSVRNVLARVLGEFKRSGHSGHSARLGQMAVARAYRDGGLPLPDDLAGLGD